MPARPQKLEISREEIRAIFAKGEDAVIELVENLVARINSLEERLALVEDQLAKNSHNSSKPPSGDGFGKRTKSLRTKSNRPSGGQIGHPGETLEWRENPDYVEEHRAESCGGCGHSLVDVEVSGWSARQVHDLPSVELEVTEHRSEEKSCPHCGLLNQGRFPSEVSQPIQYGARLKAQMVYLLDGQMIPSNRVCELLADFYGAEVSEGTIYNARSFCAEALAPGEQAVLEALKRAEVVHFDETGMRVGKKGWWLHVASTDELTAYFIHPKRGKLAMDPMGILPVFQGTAIHDGFKSYTSYSCYHGLCNSHHLRELTFVYERHDPIWSDQMIDLLLKMKKQVELAKEAGKSSLEPENLAQLEKDYQRILDLGFAANPPPVPDPEAPKKRGRKKQTVPKNLLDRLQAKQTEVLRFLYDFAVPFDNNLAERDLRMMKLKQKISGVFRSEAGARQFCRIRGHISTLRKQGRDVMDALTQVFMGTPVSPLPE